MDAAVQRCHQVFTRYAQGSSRWLALAEHDPGASLRLQQDVYIGGCTSAKAVADNARNAAAFFAYFVTTGEGFMNTNEFAVAAWANSWRRLRGRSGGKTARSTLLWVEAATGESVFAESPVVKQQCRPPRPPGGIAPAPEPAVAPELWVIKRFELLITTAPTAVQRCIAGFITLLALVSARASDLLRSRCVSVTQDAVIGQSLMKAPKGVWVKWYAPRKGLSMDDWAGPWLEQLRVCGLPGPDYILAGFDASLGSWLPRRANFADVNRALRAMLVTQCGLSAQAAAAHTPHGLRGVLNTAGQQLRRQGHVDERGMESLGHWERGSKMPGKYDTASGVGELDTRSVIVGALRAGWAPARDGEVSSPYVPAAALGDAAPRLAGGTAVRSSQKRKRSQRRQAVAGVQKEEAEAVAKAPCFLTACAPISAASGSSRTPLQAGSKLAAEQSLAAALPCAVLPLQVAPLLPPAQPPGGMEVKDGSSANAVARPAAPDLIVVGHRRSRFLHVAERGGSGGLCGWWRTLFDQRTQEWSPDAVFDVPTGWDFSWCPRCVERRPPQ